MFPNKELSATPAGADFLVGLKPNRLTTRFYLDKASYDYGTPADTQATLLIVTYDPATDLAIATMESGEVFGQVDSIASILGINAADIKSFDYVITATKEILVASTDSAVYLKDTTNPVITISNARFGQLAIDTWKATQITANLNTIILAYQKDATIYMRDASDNFAVESVIGNPTTGDQLWQIGLTTGNRFQFTTRYIAN